MIPRGAVRAALPMLVGALLGCDAPGRRIPDFDPGPTPAEFAEGERLFERSCVECHGRLALGTDRGPPLVHPYYEPSHHADAAFVRAVQVGVVPHHWRFGPMPPIPGLSTEDVDRIVGYVRWLQRRAGIY